MIFDSHWVFVNDCGGQPPFLDAAALFPQNNCLQFFPLKLNESLDEKPEFSYYVNNEAAKIDECLLLTHKQMIETLAKSVASIEPPHTPSSNVSPKVAKFTIVGTFYDKVGDCTETLEKKESDLEQVLEPYLPFHVGSKMILPLNAITTDKEERKQSAEKLQELIFNASDITMKVNMRLCWFGFYLSLLTIAEEQHAAVLNIHDCYKLGDFLGMKKNETQQAIHFFHDISLLMHFDTPKLRNFVIINTKPVLKTVSQLISVSFLDTDFLARQKILITLETKKQLQCYGFFNLSTLKKYLDYKITAELLLDVLEHVKLIAVIAQGTTLEYFMPCALSYAPESDLSLCISRSPYPWVIRLKQRQGVKNVSIPHSYTCQLSTYSCHLSSV